MNSIEKAFKKGPAFIGFVSGGDGGVEYTIDCCLQLIEGGVDVLEIGMPFSDPIADGPVIQRASQRSLEQGTTSSTMLEIAQGIRQKANTPLILFSYFNPLLKRGQGYLRELKQAGFDAVLTVDLPPPINEETTHPYYTGLEEAGLQSILVATQSTSDERLEQIKMKSQGFIYYACQKGTTGMRDKLPIDFADNLMRLKKNLKVPVAAGFGIANKETAKIALQHANGFVVGSAFVKLMEEKACPTELKKLAQLIDPRGNMS